MDNQNYLHTLKEIKSVVFATVDSKNRPQVRVINIMIAEDDKLYFVTARGKEFYDQLTNRQEVSVIGQTQDNNAIRLFGKVKKMEPAWRDRVFRENPGMGRLYTEDKRHILDVFCIYEGYGECFDLGAKPALRTKFSFGGMEIEPSGFVVNSNCDSCGICKKQCLVDCISEGTPYAIDQSHCIQCGICFEACPSGAIVKNDIAKG